MDARDEDTKRKIIGLMRRGASPAASGKAAIEVTGDRNIVAGRDVHVHLDSSRSKLKGEAANTWRMELCAAIRARAWDLRLSEEQLQEIASRKLGKAVAFLDKLSARDLSRLYDAVLSMKRPSLD